MFWGKRKPSELRESPSLLTLATKLGIERRRNVRVRYPVNVSVCKLPEIFFDGHQLKIQDISVGGCCVFDPGEFMGQSVGHDIELDIHWSTVRERVKARIVFRVDDRRHIQFQNLSANRRSHLVKSMVTGARGLSMSRHAFSTTVGPTIDAVELWSSPHHDSLSLESDVHRLAQVHLKDEQYLIFREAWPNKAVGGKCSRSEFEHLLLFLTNIPGPTPGLKSLLTVLERQLEREE